MVTMNLSLVLTFKHIYLWDDTKCDYTRLTHSSIINGLLDGRNLIIDNVTVFYGKEPAIFLSEIF